MAPQATRMHNTFTLIGEYAWTRLKEHTAQDVEFTWVKLQERDKIENNEGDVANIVLTGLDLCSERGYTYVNHSVTKTG